MKKRGRAQVGVRVCCTRFLWLRVALHDACITHGMPPSLSTLPNTLMLLPILARRFLTVSRKCAAIFGVNDDGRRRIGGGGGFNNANVIQDTIRSAAFATMTSDNENASSRSPSDPGLLPL